MKGPIAVVGAGQAGTLLAVYLARQGHEVTLYEGRPDLRTTEVAAGRSINLALATRGIVPLVDVGVIDRVDAITIPMRGRMVHPVDGGPPVLQPYGSRAHEVIHSISRTDLNALLLDAAEVTGRVRVEFSKKAVATVRPRRAGTLGMGRRPISANVSVRSRISSRSERDIPSIPRRCRPRPLAGEDCRVAVTSPLPQGLRR